MKRRIAIMLGLLTPVWSGAALAAGGGQFDGSWNVNLACPAASDGAQAYTFNLTGNVRNSTLHAVRGQAGQPGWLSLDGRIRPDGAASLLARGLTGSSSYNVKHAAPGVAFHYPVSAHFDASGGTGNWVAMRTCNFTFRRM